MFFDKRSNSGIPYHTSPSGGNCLDEILGLFDSKGPHTYHINNKDFGGDRAVLRTFQSAVVGAQRRRIADRPSHPQHPELKHQRPAKHDRSRAAVEFKGQILAVASQTYTCPFPTMMGSRSIYV